MSSENADCGESAPPSWIKDGELVPEELKAVVSALANKLASSSLEVQREGATSFLSLINTVWTLETHAARDSADLIATEIRTTGGLDSMLQLYLAAEDEPTLRATLARSMEQILVSANRTYLSEHKICDQVVGVACSHPEGIGILENLLKVSADTCNRIISCGALESIIRACRNSDSTVTQHCAAALANCAMYGGHRAQATMVSKHADHWLFPLAFSEDRVVKYYALIAICFLGANPDLNEKVTASGTLRLVLPFLNSHKPEEFFRIYPINYAHGRSAGWLKRLLYLLKSSNEKARSLASFHFAMEAVIKRNQRRIQVFTEIGAIDGLKEAAKRGSRLTAKLCCQALVTCDVAPPPYQCWDVLRWSTKNVAAWVEDIGLKQLVPSFEEHLVTGNILVDMTMDDLLELGFQSKLRCKWFLEEIRKLRCLADVMNSKLDKDKVCKWLTKVSPNLSVYHVDFVRRGVTKSVLPYLTNEVLIEIGVHQRLDRLRILVALGEVQPTESGRDTPDENPIELKLPLKKPTLTRLPTINEYDVYICYRWMGGSQLASLIKVHLEVQGISVFLDVYGLSGGNFEEAIVSTLSRTKNMVLVLTPGTLDRCKGDTRIQDWLHREIICAIDSKIKIVPVVDPEFKWPKDDELPEDIHNVIRMNGVPWSHEFQDASVTKLIEFLNLPVMRGRNMKRGSLAPLPRLHSSNSVTGV